MRPFNIEIIFIEGIDEGGEPLYGQIEKYFKRWCPDLCCYNNETDVTNVRCTSFPVTETGGRKLRKVKRYRGYSADCSVLFIDKKDIPRDGVNRSFCLPFCDKWRAHSRLSLRKKAVLVIVHSDTHDAEQPAFSGFQAEVEREWKGVMIVNPSSVDVLKGTQQAIEERNGTSGSNRANEIIQWLKHPDRRRQILCIAGRGRKTVQKVQSLLDASFGPTDIETQILHIKSSKIHKDNVKSVTHAICCADRSERNILFSAHGEPDELTLSVNYFEKARKRTLIIEYGGEDPPDDQLYDTFVFKDSMKRGQPRLKAFMDKNNFLSLSEKLNEKQKKAIMHWLGREED